MKLLIFTVLIVLVANAYADNIEEQWAEYKVKHNKNYAPEEEPIRFELFKKEVARVDEHNAKHARGEVSFVAGLNAFSDWTDEQKSKLHGVLPIPTS